MTKAATCTATGTQSRSCASCGKTESSTIAATGHNWSAWKVTKAATCTAAGTESRSCASCGSTETNSIAATGHQHTELRNVTAATCAATGYTGDTWCTDCNTKISSGSTIAAKGHTWNSGVITRQPTASQDGIKTYTCTTCGGTKTETVKYQAKKTAPTVSLVLTKTSAGKIVITGQVDDYENLENYYEITAHGLLYMKSSSLGSRLLTLNTSGRTNVTFGAYNDDGTYSYTFKPTSKTTAYAFRAYITYTDPTTGKSVTVYSTMTTKTYNNIK